MNFASLDQSVQYMKGVGPGRAELLGKLGIHTLGDLLFHFPRSYDDLSDVRAIGQLSAGVLQTVHGEIVEMEGKTLNNGRPVVSIVIADGQGQCLEGVWFNQTFVTSGLRFGQKLAFSGKPKWFRDHWQMNHPRVQSLEENAASQPQVLPVYPLTENLHIDALRRMIQTALEMCAGLVEDILPPELRDKHRFAAAEPALRQVHFPASLAEALRARRRFIYEEFLVLQVSLALRRRELRDRRLAPKLPVDQAIDEHIRRLFPFPLTRDQDRAVATISKDLAGDRPMQRLLQADVGAGKTAVAVYGLLVAVANKHQAALMAPTEVLARQHWQTLEGYLAKSRVRRLLLTGGLNPRQRKQALEDIEAGNVDLVVGTQALVQEDVRFKQLGLVVIDEQHKFGVHQRAHIRQQGNVDPHYLVMTATPIPRTVALTVFGDLDTSIIRQLPPGRQPVSTRWVEEKQRDRIYEHVRDELKKGRQGFVICPLVEESESLDLRAAEQLHVELKDGVFRELRLGLLHGRIDDAGKQKVMDEFRAGKLDALISTLVVEVGVDVPNATLMIVEHAERFGLSQLHQLRGRVTRGTIAGECYLFATAPTDEARERLRVMTRTTDGFALAEEDARLRGLGELFGTRQHGLGELRFGDLLHDHEILQQAREDAHALVAGDATLRDPKNAGLRKRVVERYGKTLDLVTVG